MSGGGGGGGGSSAAANRLYDAQADISREMWDIYKAHGLPLISEMTTEAMGGADDAEYIEAAGRARADVAQQFGIQRSDMQRNLSRYGINPASGRYVGMQRGLALGEAAASADAQNKSRQRIEDLEFDKKTIAANLLAGNPGQAISGIGGAASGLSANANAAAKRKADETAGLLGAIGTAAGLALSL